MRESLWKLWLGGWCLVLLTRCSLKLTSQFFGPSRTATPPNWGLWTEPTKSVLRPWVRSLKIDCFRQPPFLLRNNLQTFSLRLSANHSFWNSGIELGCAFPPRSCWISQIEVNPQKGQPSAPRGWLRIGGCWCLRLSAFDLLLLGMPLLRETVS